MRLQMRLGLRAVDGGFLIAGGVGHNEPGVSRGLKIIEKLHVAGGQGRKPRQSLRGGGGWRQPLCE